MRSPNRKVGRAQEDNLFDRTDVEAWQHVELTVTNCSFGLTIKFIVNTAVLFRCAPVNILSIRVAAGYQPAPRFWVTIARGTHPFPSRTRKLSPSAPMVLHARVCGSVGSCPVYHKARPKGRAFVFSGITGPVSRFLLPDVVRQIVCTLQGVGPRNARPATRPRHCY